MELAAQAGKPSINGGLASMPSVQSGFAMGSSSHQAAALHQQQQQQQQVFYTCTRLREGRRLCAHVSS